MIVPEIMSGAMENVAAVTYNEKYVKRQKMTQLEKADMVEVIAHEMQVVEELLEQQHLVAAGDDEIGDAVLGIDVHDMQDDRLAADLDHRLGHADGFFRKTSTFTTAKNYCLHGINHRTGTKQMLDSKP